MKLLLALLLLAAPAFALPSYGQATLTSASSTWCANINDGQATAVVTLSGTWTGPVSFLVSAGRLTGNVQQVSALATSFPTQAASATASGNGVFILPVSGFSQVCVTPPSAGSMTVYAELNMASFSSFFTTQLTASASATVALQPNPNFVLQRCNAVRQTICR